MPSDRPSSTPASGGPDQTPIAAIVLAAGASTRLGRPKQLLEFRGQTLVRRGAESALHAGCSPVIVVLGAVPQAAEELGGLDVTLIHAADWAVGMGASIRAGVAAVPASAGALLLTLCDQPWVNAAVLRRLIDAHCPGGITAAGYFGTVGVPAVFDRSFFPDLQQLPPPAGAKQLFAAHADQVYVVPVAEAEQDIDTIADYERLRTFDEESR